MATEVDQLRQHLLIYNRGEHAAVAGRSDDELQAAINLAKVWIGGRRLSWTIVAKYILVDGHPHA